MAWNRPLACSLLALAATIAVGIASCGGRTAAEVDLDAGTTEPDTSPPPTSTPAPAPTPAPTSTDCKKQWEAPVYPTVAYRSALSCMVVPAKRCEARTVCCASECLKGCKPTVWSDPGYCQVFEPLCMLPQDCLDGGVLPWLGPDAKPLFEQDAGAMDGGNP